MMELDCRYYRTYPVGDPKGHASERLQLDPARTVFLLVDVYGVGFDSDQAVADVPEFYRSQAQRARKTVVDHIAPAKRAAKTAGLQVVYLTNYLSPGLTRGSEWRNLSLRVHDVDV